MDTQTRDRLIGHKYNTGNLSKPDTLSMYSHKFKDILNAGNQNNQTNNKSTRSSVKTDFTVYVAN